LLTNAAGEWPGHRQANIVACSDGAYAAGPGLRWPEARLSGCPGTATRLRVIEIQLDALLDLRLAIHMRTGRYDRRYGHGTGAAHRPSPFLPGRAEPP